MHAQPSRRATGAALPATFGGTMDEIKWDPSLAVGVPAIDADHRFLVELIQRLDALHAGDKDPEVLWGVLQELDRYTEYHFAREEEFMRRCNFDQFRSHRAEHRDMTFDIKRMMREYRRGHVDVDDIIEFMVRWFFRHITGTDTLLATAVRKAGLEIRP